MYQRQYAVKPAVITDELTWGKFTNFWLFHTHILRCLCQTSDVTGSYDYLPKDISLNYLCPVEFEVLMVVNMMSYHLLGCKAV
jgi:hypothetical protein